MKNSKPQLLFISNGHGEDLISCQIIQHFRQICPNTAIAALPIVGEGKAYHRLNVEIISPTLPLPSGGVFYMNPFFLIKDLWAGLIQLTWQQLRGVWRYAPHCDLIMATGDIVVALFAFLTGKKYILFLAGNSSYYENRLNLGLIMWCLLQSPRCLKVFTRDNFTAEDLRKQGLSKADFIGNPIMDKLQLTGEDLQLKNDAPMIALLPGSRLPEAQENLQLILELVKFLNSQEPSIQFCAALVPNLLKELDSIYPNHGWEYSNYKLKFKENPNLEISCYSNAFPDILHRANLVIGMTGTAVEQAVGLGKPVIAIPGKGPAFTYRFAEAQNRLLGCSVQVISNQIPDQKMLKLAAEKILLTLADSTYLQTCRENGLQRMGKPGGSEKIARFLANYCP